jgi:hypothetical protein
MVKEHFEESLRLAKWLTNLDAAANRLIQEGVCDECGVYDTIYHMGDCNVCSVCRKNLTNTKKR